jgi:ribosomal protein S18 acetylase RimI-like enzyme
MASPAVLDIRPAEEKDRSRLTHLLHFETYVHRHLDWRQPVDWLGNQPYFVIERAGRVSAALACPPDPPNVAWIRLFACTSRLGATEAWELLWPEARAALRHLEAEQAVALPLHKWFRHLLEAHDFKHAHNVVVLDWQPTPDYEPPKTHPVRAMRVSDLEAVQRVDNAAFPPLWRNSLNAVELSFKQAAYARVIEEDGRLAAYQISTPSSQGLHLARLAVDPDFQGRGLAFALGQDVKRHASQYAMQRVTVNTQTTNVASLGLYKKMGFDYTGDEYPVYSQELA